MPSNRQTQQGHNVPQGMRMRSTRHVVRQRTPLNGQMGGTQDTTTVYETPAQPRRQRRSVQQYNPARAGSQATSGIGMLEAEFFIAIGLLILLMFVSTSASYTDRIMSFMKRGTLTCLLFFVLALVASAGGNAAKIAKAFGGLVIVALLVTAPIETVITDVDALIKNDWVGTSETANESSSGSAPSSDTGTGTTSSNAIINAIKTGLQDLQSLLGPLDPGNAANALKQALHL